MIRRNVQGVEIIIFGFNLRPFNDREVHGTENIGYLPLDTRERMQMSHIRPYPRQGEVKLPCSAALASTLKLFRNKTLKLNPQVVKSRADGPPLFDRQVFERAQEVHELALFS